MTGSGAIGVIPFVRSPSHDPSIRLRPALLADARPAAASTVAIWQEVYRGLLPASALGQFQPSHWVPRFRQACSGVDRLFLAEQADGQIVGYGLCGPVGRDPAGIRGELFELYVAPLTQRRGVGRGLAALMAGFLQMHDRVPVGVWALAANERALAFYRALGGVACATGTTVFGGVRYPLVGCRFDDLDQLMGLPMAMPTTALRPRRSTGGAAHNR